MRGLGGPMQRYISRAALVGIILSVSGCKTGLTTAPGPSLGAVNQNLPMDKLRNDADDPNSERFALDVFCGHLVEQTPTGYRPLYVAAYPAGQAPTMVTPSTNAEQDYHSLVDQGGASNVAAAFGAGSGSFDLSGEDRLEVTVTTDSYCKTTTLDKAAIANAVAQLSALSVDLAKVYYVGMATHTVMTVDHLESISSDAKAAATPIVNIGGSIYSKDQATKAAHFISIDAVPVNTAAAAPAGTNVTTNTVPPVPAQAPHSTNALVMAPFPLQGAHTMNRQTVTPEEFRSGLQAARADKSIHVQ
jgi:hypothetical protein